MTELLIRKSIDVDAPVETLWKILTDPEFIRQYMLAAMPRRTGSRAPHCCGGARRMGWSM